MKIINRDPKKLIAAEYNPRKLSSEQFEQIKSSLQRFGFVDPVIVNKHPDRMDIIIGGHQRVKVATVLGFETVPTVELNIDEAQERELNIRLNKNTGEFDWDVLKDQFDKLDLESWGFTQEELSVFDDEIELPDDEPVPDPPENPKTEKGQLYKLGRHVLMCGDSTSEEDVKRLMDGADVDMWITDPPYNVDYTGKTKNALKIDNDEMSDTDFRQFLVKAYASADSVMRKGAVFYIWHADSEGHNFRGACMDVGWIVRQCLIWVKQVMVMGRQDYHWKHEPCLYGWKDGAAHTWSTDRKQTTVLEFDRPMRNEQHPTMKPVDLITYQIKNNTKPGDKVLDSFGGSGTTMLACEKTGRACYMMEFDPKYCDVIVKRYAECVGANADDIFEKGFHEQ
jgi:DNA modification methylase